MHRLLIVTGKEPGLRPSVVGPPIGSVLDVFAGALDSQTVTGTTAEVLAHLGE